MNKLKAIAVLGALVLFAGSAYAQGSSLGWGQRQVPTQSGTNPQGTLKVNIMGGIDPSDTSGVPFQFDGTTGALKNYDVDRDRDFPLITNLFSGQQLTAGQTYQMQVGIPMMQYTRAAIMLTWAMALADTDSVRIAVRVYGATSSTSSNWHSWTPGGLATTDSCNGTGYVAGDTTTTSPQRCLAPNISFWVQKAPWMSTTSPSLSYLASKITQGSGVAPAAGQIKLRKIPLPIVRFASANGVMLNLTDNYGAPCPFPYILVEVTNAGRQTLTNIEANVWPRVQ